MQKAAISWTYIENDWQQFQTGEIGMTNSENLKGEEPNAKPSGSPTPTGLPSPKRGAFPTPKAEIESAKPYIPDPDQTGDHLPTDPDLPANADEGGK
ncbi:hypothetical protein [Nostoc sp.]|uniref:hypothetical protein n=1 Tax=Nostoc sp. TaxID=1180 RepID=UPI002FF4C909